MTAEQRALAPAPLVDRFPIVVGQSINATYLANVFRLSTSGYRQQFVDVLNELLEQDPHLFSVMQKRILSTANGRVEVIPAELPKGHPDAKKAQKMVELCQREVDRIPDLAQNLASLLWAIYYGLSASEIFWSRDADGWHVDRLAFVHSRRLSYPDYQSWSLYIWDQGQVLGWGSPFGSSPTNSNIFGLKLADWPGKFIVHAPQMRGDYPTREGVGRQVAIWSLFKRLGARGAVNYLERFAQSFMDVAYTTTDKKDPRESAKEDIELAKSIAATIGPGGASSAVHPNTITINPQSFDGGGRSKITWPEWIQLCNSEISKAALGSTLGTEVGTTGGNRSLGEVMERSESDLEGYDAKTLGESLRRDLFAWIVRLNAPDCLHLVPQALIHVDADPEPKALLAVAQQLTDIGAPVDLDDLSEQVGIALVPNEPGPDGNVTPRRSFKSDVADPFAVDDGLKSDEAKQRDQDQADRDHEVAKAKAQQPVVAGPGGKTPSGKPDNAAAKPAKKVLSTEDYSLQDMRDTVALLMSDKAKYVPREVYDQLLEDYPARSLGWILPGHWTGPEEVAIEDIDVSNAPTWRASHEPIQPYIDRIDRRGSQKPIILVKTPGNTKYIIVDGHHRFLACKQMGVPVLAYVAEMHTDEGPWDDLHNSQRSGSSRGSFV